MMNLVLIFEFGNPFKYQRGDFMYAKYTGLELGRGVWREGQQTDLPIKLWAKRKPFPNPPHGSNAQSLQN